MFFLHDMKFCINQAILQGILPNSFQILMNISILYTKMIKIGAFLKIELHVSYVHHKKAEII